MSKKTYGADGRFYEVSPEGAKRCPDAVSVPARAKNPAAGKPRVDDGAASATRISGCAKASPEDGAASATRIKP